MSQIETLIERLCPNGVEYQTLEDVLDYEQPTKYLVESTNYSSDYSTPVLTAGQTFILGYTNEVSGIYEANKINPVIIFDDFTTAFKWVDFRFKAKSSAMKMLNLKPEAQTSLRFVYFWMTSIKFQPKDHARHWISTYSKFRFPLLPLEVQQEIVRILDTFTELETELEAELEARKKQYEHYRNALLKFGDEHVQWLPMGDVCTIKTGQSVSKELISLNPGVYPVINSGRDPLGFINTFNTVDDPIGITSRGAGVGSITWQRGEYFRGNLNYSATIKDTTRLSQDYLFHVLNFLQPEIQRLCTYQGIPALNKENLKKLGIPVVSLQDQEKIAATLTVFSEFTAGALSGLPAEIAARRKQYEYYRAKLLTFKELVA